MTSPRIRPLDRVNGRGSRQHTPRQSLVAALLFTAAIGLTWLGSADVPIDTRNSAFWYRTLREIPGLTDVCGDFTWLARAIPPALAAVGALIAFLPRRRSITSWGAGAFGIALAAALWVATTQNAIPMGELHCIS
jgi:hypothetical protein